MRKLFDFSIPLTNKRFNIFMECIHRYYDYLLSDTLNDRLLLYVVRILACAHLQNADEYSKNVTSMTDNILHSLNDILFSDANESSSLKGFKEEYESYVKWVEAQEHKHNTKQVNTNEQ